MAQYGEAANYYSGAPQQPQGAYHQGQPYGQQPPPQQYGYGHQPPQYGQNYGPPQGPPPPQNYGPPQGPPPPMQQPYEMGQQQNGYQQMDYDDNKQGFEQQFKIDKPKYNDWWAGLLFIAVFLGYTAVSAIAIRGYSQTNSGGIYGSANQFALNSNTIILFAFIIGMATVFSYAYMWAARKFTKQFIWITGILSVLFGLATAIYMLYRQYWSGGIVFLIFALFHAFCFYTWIPRIPFSVVMLQTAIDVAKQYGHTYVVSLAGGILAAALSAWYAVTLVSIYAQYTPNGANSNCRNGVGDCGNGKVIGLIVFITFSMYWISEWLKNTIHTTISGVYGSWYFNPNAMPKGATRGAFKRSVTYSFGSISLGSLLVAIIQFLRQICSVAQRSASADGNMVGAIMFCILGCLIGLLEWAVEFLNRYAFSYIALYGKSYIDAAKDTWKMIKDRGIDALVNECLIGPVLSMGASFVGYSCALLAYLYMVFTDPPYNSDGGFTPVVVAFAFVMGLQICKIFTTPLSSGIDTIFVGMAWDPEVLMREHPDLYQRMIAVYPHVQEAIHA